MEEWAWRAGVAREDWPECIDEVIEDVALKLRSAPTRTPTHLALYFVEAARMRWRTLVRARQGRLARLVTLTDGPPVGLPHPMVCAESAVAPLASEYGRRAARGATADPDPVAPALLRMATWIRDQLSDNDQR